MKELLKKNRRNRAIISALILFGIVAFIVSIAITIIVLLGRYYPGNSTLTAIVMLIFIGIAAALGAVIVYIYKYFSVDKSLISILDATEKIANGDFTVRLPIKHSLSGYNELDLMKDYINKMAAELSHTEVLHTDFISNVSHEIKTPLAIIQNYATSLQNTNLDEQTRIKYAETLASASKRLTALITNILKLNKLENQEIKPEYETINLTETLAETVLGYEELIESKGLELDCDFDEDIQIVSSTSYLEIVWNNLLSNAIKFTESGGKITVSLKEERGRAVVKVSDTGCGISAETGKYIFEKFYQGDTSHAQEGNGLGLALVKKVIDIIGGSISVKSEIGKGSTFTVILPKEI